MTSSRESRISALPDHLREALRRRLAGQAERSDAIPRADRDAPLPLSFAQQRLWFLNEFQPDDTEYNSAIAVRLRGALDVDALTRAVRELPRRHESLRTTFRDLDGTGVQTVWPPRDLPVPVTDLSGTAGPDAVRRVLHDEFARPFDLRRGPLFRALLVRCSAQDHVLLLSSHHIVVDGWSLGVLVEELSALYTTALRGDSPDTVAAPPIQYADFAVWQRNRLSEEAIGAHLDYWRQALSGSTPLDLPTDRPRPAVRTSAGAAHEFVVPRDTTARLGELARSGETTLFTVLLAACQALLARYSGQHDISVGTVTSGRNRPELNRLVGFFVNTVVLRCTVDGQRSFRDFLASVKDTALDAFGHDEVPFERLVDALAIQRDVSRNPLFDVMVVLQNAQRQLPAFTGLRVSEVSLPRWAANFDVTFEFSERDGALAGVVEYNTELFDATTIERLAGHLQTLLHGICAAPDTPLARLPLLTEPESRQLLTEWNGTDRTVPPSTFPEIFEAQVRRTPDATALVFQDNSFSYTELNAAANRLAHHLIGLGAGPERRVALALPRGYLMIIAQLAVLKAGAAFVPVDPGQPADRIERLIADIEPVVVLTPETVAARHHCPETNPTDADRNGPLLPGTAAYLIYTSGSTGTPKGVVVEHRNLVNLLHHHRDRFLAPHLAGPGERLNVALTAAFTFDTSLEGTVLMGAGHRLHLIDDATRMDPDALVEYIRTHHIDFLDLTPTFARQLLPAGLLTGAGHRPRILMLGGEALPDSLWRQLAAADGTASYNFYGPTETTIDATAVRISARHSPNIGRPLSNVRAYLVDDHLQPVPVGVPGELYLAGDQTARGYHHRPGLTAQRFVPNPFGPPGSRLYRTGDRARWTRTGQLEYLGRADDQIKIHGHRIEPGEVEAALTRHGGIAEAVVTAAIDGSGHRHLVGYVVPAPGHTVAAADLRAWLKRCLPDYLVPTGYVVLPELPVTPHGKVDRVALPAPEFQPLPAESYTAPRTPTEELLVRVWSEVLDVERVGVTDNFFELGGDSILSIQIVSQARRHGVQVTTRDIFHHQTIEQLAAIAAPHTPVAPAVDDTAPLTDLDPAEIARIAGNGVPADLVDSYPLTPLQSGMLFHSLVDTGSESYVDEIRLRLSGVTEPESLGEAWQRVVDRTPVLRTSIVWAGVDEPVQVVHRAATLPITYHDWRSMSIQDSSVEVAASRLDPTTAPLMRLAIGRVTDDEVLLIWTVHHLILDGWSTGQLFAEVCQEYTAIRDGSRFVPERRRPFRDYLAWLGQQDQHEAETHWRQVLHDITAPTPLPYDRPPTEAHRARSSAVLAIDLPVELSDRLRQMASSNALTVNTVVQGAWALLLSHHTGETDIIHGTTVAGRPPELPGIHTIIGMFINTIPTRTTTTPHQPLTTWLHTLQTHQTTNQRHDHIALPQLHTWTHLPPTTTLFNSIVAFENYPLDDSSMTGLGVRVVTAHDTTNFPLCLTAYLTDRKLHLSIGYDPALFDAGTIERMAGHLDMLLTGIATNPHRTIAELEILTPAERRAVLHDWNDTGSRNPAGTVPGRFEARARRTPDAIAVRFGNVALTYHELDRRANRLAHRLIRLGVRPEDRVGLLMGRSVELVTAILAILKAGAAYLPLDLRAPTARLGTLLAEGAPPVVITDHHWQSTARSIYSGQLVPVGSDVAVWPEPDDQPGVPVHPDNLCYVMYTSGSTGVPKGVAARHRDVVALAADHRFAGGGHRCVLLHSPLAFDASTYELWVPLLNGGEVVVAPPGEITTAALRREITERQVTGLWLTAGLFRAIGLDDPDCFAGLREVWTGGDVVPPGVVRAVRAACPGLVVVDGYGPTETTTFATTYRIAADEPVPQVLPIGRPLANMRAYVLDGRLRPVPPRVPGELYIAGAGLARGYHNRPAPTAERFLANPYDGPGTRMYRTGDLVRWTTGGELEFLGRADAQVKIRGYRIELGEIEEALAGHPDIGTAVVVAREDEPGVRRLVAYLVPETGATAPDGAGLRDWCGRTLPDYMLPAAFLMLDAIPLNANGKLDWRALPAPDWPALTHTEYRAPRTPAEQVIADIWAAVLDVDRVGVEDNFFELGGDSVLSIRVTARLRAAFGVDVSPRVLFSNPTVAALAATLPDTGTAEPCVPAIPAAPRDGDLPLSFGQRRLWFLYEFEPDSSEYLTPLALRLRGELDVERLGRVLTALVGRHESLRTTFEFVNGAGRQVIRPPRDVPVRQLDLSELPDPEHELRRVLRTECTEPFDLRGGPVFRNLLVRLAADDHVLVLCLHHIVTDGWSMAVLINEFGELYNAFTLGIPPTLPELPVGYADFAAWQQESLTEARAAAQLAYWRRQLDGVPPLRLPTDRPRPAVYTTNGAQYEFTVPAGLTAMLRDLGHEQDGTLFMTLVAACQLLLARHTGQDDIAVGTVTSGRGRAELEHVVGFFVNTLTIRSVVDGQASFRTLLGAVRNTVLDAFAHQDVAFERVVEHLRPVRDTSRTPLFQAMVLLRNLPVRVPELAGLSVADVPVPVVTASVDLSFEFVEQGDTLSGTVEYNIELFDAGTIERIAERLLVLLEGIATAPEVPVRRLPLLTESERHRLLVEYNDTAREAPADTLPEIFQRQVRRTPDASALVYRDITLSYAELNRAANRLAHRLIALGAGPERIVALALPRDQRMITAQLAVWKAGAAFLPLDPDQPADRIDHLLRDARPVVVLDPEQLRAPLDDCPDTDPTDADRTGRPGPDNAAYVIYTSGSTGQPKGVLVAQRNLANLLRHHRDRFLRPHLAGRGGRLRVGLTATFTFDTSLESQVLLAAGHELHVIDGATRMDPAALVDYVAERHIDFLDLTPTYLSQLIPAGLLTNPRHVPAVLMLGGEPITDSLWTQLSTSDRTTCYNFYGPTETTIDATFTPVTGDRPTIGRPLSNLRAYVLDAAGAPVPTGVVGELYLAGEQTARGYLNQPGLTARSFVANPFGPPGSRMYRTGDLASWTADGRLRFAGRVDDQVKIRGFRIEPGEIESRLRQHPKVRDTAVVAWQDPRDDRAGHHRLVGYLVPVDPANAPETSELRDFLGQRLPDYLVPSAFVPLDRLPLTAHGKLDRDRLPAPDPSRSQDRYVAPRSDAEQALAGIWSEALGVPRVGIDDNFFELGGDSILSIQIVSQARQHGLRLTTKEVFGHQTIRQLAAIASPATSAPAVARPEPTGPAPLTPIQHWFFDTHGALNHWTMSLTLELDPEVDVAALRTAAHALVAHHDALCTRFEFVDGAWWQHVRTGEAAGIFRAVELSDADDADDRDAAMRDAAVAAQASLDITAGPVFRAILFELGDGQRPLLFLTAHHLVVDGVSWRILLGDLDTAYQQVRAGRPVRLEPVTTSFAEWARRLTELVLAGQLDGDLPYWSAVDAPAALPVDRPDTGTAGQAGTVTVELDRQHTTALLRQVPAVYRTEINDILLTALGAALARWTGRDRVLIAAEGHGREDILPDADTTRTVGWFTSQYPVALNMPAGTDWGAAIRSVKEQLRAIPRHGLSHAALRYLSPADSPARALGNQPAPWISFNYHGQWHPAGEDGGLIRGPGPAIGQDFAPDSGRDCPLDVTGLVADGRLRLSWLYSGESYEETTIRRLADDLLHVLREIIEHCTGPDAGGRTPSDFPLTRLDQEQIDRIAGNGRTVEDIYPLTPMQAGMLFHSLVDTESGAYLDQITLRLGGVRRPESVAAAWQRVVDRTPVLRSSLVWQDVPEPLQVVHRTAAVPCTYHDWRELSTSDQNGEIQRAMAADRRDHIDLTTAPLMRLTIGRTGADEVVLIWTSHHVLLDGWSNAQVFTEMFREYAAIATGQPYQPEYRRPFRDYLAWLGQQDQHEAETHWRQVLHDITAPTPLPYDRPPTEAHRAESTESVHTELSTEQSDRLRRVAQRRGLTVNTVVQGAWALLLSHHTGETDIIHGTTVAGRPPELPGIHTIIGMFINTIPTRTTTTPHQPLTTWLHTLQTHQTTNQRHDHIALPQLHTWTHLPPTTTLFNSIVAFENYPIGDAGIPGAPTVTELGAVDTTSAPLVVRGYLGDRLSIDLDHDPRLFDRDTIRTMSGYLRALLLGIVDCLADDPDRPLSGVPWLPAAQRNRVLVAWNDTERAIPPGTVVDRFAAQVCRTPDAVAVVSGDISLSYAELDARTNRLAHRLIRLGIRPEDRVGVLMGRSIDQVSAVLAIVKAGAVYLPLDERAPAGRLRELVTGSGTALLVTDRTWAGMAGDIQAGPVLDITADDSWADEPEHRPEVPIDPENLVYVIHTSGSTGKPKGVAIRHRGVVALAAERGFATDGQRRVLMHATLAFDASTYELWIPLLNGGRIVLAPPGNLAAGTLRRMIDEHGVTGLLIPAGLFRALAQDTPGCLAGVREVWTGGDVVPAGAVRAVRAACPELTVLDIYGPTEITMSATHHALPTGQPVPDTVPIGRPQDNMRTYVLDPGLRPVPPRIPGELYIGGAGLARGYLNRPGLTAERFLADPYGAPGGRMYRTGDLVRWTAGGELEFLGRADDQVKVRGFRIELGEIEHTLTDHPAVAEAVVVVRQSEQGSKRLVACLVPAGATPDTAELREHLGERLPDYMIPAAFQVLDALPLNANGKVDRRALPDPDWAATRAVAYRPPRDATEEVLAQIWAEVLDLDRVGVHDNFFELGGDSIVSIRVTSRLRTAFGVELSPRALFSSPTIAGLAAAVRGEAPAERAIDLVPIEPVTRDRDLPLSFAQQRLWFLHEFAPDSSEYLTPIALRLRGELRVPALASAVTGLIARHESLRTTFDTVDGQGRQVVHPPYPAELDFADLTTLPESERPARLAELLRAAGTEPFDLRHGPLLRVRLVRLAAADHVLLLTLHHIVTDAWSTGVILDELARRYASPDIEPELPKLPVQYADYAVWQRERLPESVLAEQLDYWRRQLDAVPPLELPTDRPRPAVHTDNGALREFQVPPEVAGRLRSLGWRHNGSLFSTLVAACQVLLHRWSRQTDIAVGTVTSGRERAELEHLVGFFVNTLVLRSTVDGGRTFTEFLADVRNTVLDAFRHQDVPFERVVDELRPVRDPSRTPLFQAMVVLQNTPNGQPDFPGLAIEDQPLPGVSAGFDVVIQFQELGTDGLHGVLTYNTDLFDAATMARLAEQLGVLLAGIADDPDRVVAALPLLPPREAEQLLVSWNDTATPVPPVTLAALFEAQVRRTPDAPAVIAASGVLDFAALNRRANRLARLLVRRGAGPERIIALALPRSTDIVVAQLAVTKAGAAYLPIDPAYPSDRIAFMLDDSGAGLLLTHEDLVPSLTSSTGIPTLVLDDPQVASVVDGLSADDLTDDDRRSPLHIGDAAYLIYTSGSTGTPKGVTVTHHGLANFSAAEIERFAVRAGDRVLQFSSPSFDASVLELCMALPAGAALVVPPPGPLLGEQLAEVIAGQRVNQALIPPAALATMPAAELPEFRTLVVGGDACPAELVARWSPGRRMINAYGPTEATVVATWSEPLAGTETPPIGRPIRNTRVYVLDEAMRPVPIGVPGRLYVTGDGLARGYHRRPGLTAERFVANPYGPPGSRCYHTGDLARWTADGQLHFVGRTDEQVKIRGYRIELGEIETRLRQHADVADAAVTAHEHTAGHRRLVAYVVPAAAESAPSTAALREHLRHALPDYMVPAAFLVLDRLPLSPNGKLDRAALPEPDGPPGSDTQHVSPRNPVEQILASVWAEVLGVPRVGVHDNFFELGGDSILSIQLVSRTRQAGLWVSSKDLFRHQTVAELATVARVPDAGPRDAGPITGAVPLTPIQHWFFQSRQSNPAHFNQSMLVELTEEPDRAGLDRALAAVLSRHDALRMRFEHTDGRWTAHLPAGELTGKPAGVLRHVDLSDVEPDGRAAAMTRVADDTHRGFDLTSGRLLAAVLFTFGAGGRPRLFLAAHHLAVDAVSWRVLLDDLDVAYRQAAAGEPIDLGATTTSFAEWARRLAGHVAGGALDHEVPYWSAARTAAPLPVDHTPPDGPPAPRRAVSVSLDGPATDALLRAAPAAYRTRINDVLLTALAAALGRWTGRHTVSVDLEGHGREEILDGIDLSRTVGWFTTMFPVTLATPDQAGWRARVKAVRAQLRAVPANGFGYGALRYLGPPATRDLLAGNGSAAQVGFNYLGQWDAGPGSADDPRPPSLWHAVRSGLGQDHDPAGGGSHLVEIVGAVQDGRLAFSWLYRPDLFDESTVDSVAGDFADALRDIARDCARGGDR